MSKGLLNFRLATRADVPTLVAMLADDALGAQREQFTDPLPQAYYAAFEALDRDPNNELILACLGDRVIGMLQLTYIPSLSYQGGWRALIESVRVDAAYRSQGIGRQLMVWTLERAKARGCHLAQLSTHKSRTDAHRFYERLGFEKSHVGMKLSLK
ncbi:MAG: GNAT family N-acetyltransferase [Caldilineaceae bacterium]|nr:GNAT family N-acetyltransferase [Caldilineaceae bacterium]MCB0123537.1 GNAT family N-acetyltransferase [Caldilineaceae bacterium]